MLLARNDTMLGFSRRLATAVVVHLAVVDLVEEAAGEIVAVVVEVVGGSVVVAAAVQAVQSTTLTTTFLLEPLSIPELRARTCLICEYYFI